MFSFCSVERDEPKKETVVGVPRNEKKSSPAKTEPRLKDVARIPRCDGDKNMEQNMRLTNKEDAASLQMPVAKPIRSKQAVPKEGTNCRTADREYKKAASQIYRTEQEKKSDDRVLQAKITKQKTAEWTLDTDRAVKAEDCNPKNCTLEMKNNEDKARSDKRTKASPNATTNTMKYELKAKKCTNKTQFMGTPCADDHFATGDGMPDEPSLVYLGSAPEPKMNPNGGLPWIAPPSANFYRGGLETYERPEVQSDSDMPNGVYIPEQSLAGFSPRAAQATEYAHDGRESEGSVHVTGNMAMGNAIKPLNAKLLFSKAPSVGTNQNQSVINMGSSMNKTSFNQSASYGVWGRDEDSD